MAKLTLIESPPAEPLALLVDEFIAEKRAEGAAPKTVSTYADVLSGVWLPYLRRAGITDPAAITAAVLNGWSAGLLDGTTSRSRRPLSKASVSSYSRTVNVWLAWVAAQTGVAQTAKAKLPRERKRVLDTLDRSELQALEDAATNERDKLLVRVLADTGMRISELLGLSAADLRVEGGRTVLKVRGKGDRERLVPIRPQLAKRLDRWARKARPDAASTRLFLGNRRSARTGDYEPLTPSGADQVLHDLAVRAGITKRVYPHLLRHSFVTNYLRAGGNPILCAQIVGHESLWMIQRVYQHLTVDDAAGELLRLLEG